MNWKISATVLVFFGTLVGWLPSGMAQPVMLRDGDLTLIPPGGWEQVLDRPGVTLLLQIPKPSDETFRRKIQVRFVSEPMNVKGYSVEPYGKRLQSQRQNALGKSSGYTITNSEVIELEDGNPAALYYAQFKLGGLDLMEMHLLLSSAQGHYLLTYSDTADNFANNSPGSPLANAYDSMSSARVAGRYVPYWRRLAPIGVGFAALMGWFWVKRRRNNRFDEDLEGYDSDDSIIEYGDSDEMESGQEPLSHDEDDDHDESSAEHSAVSEM